MTQLFRCGDCGAPYALGHHHTCAAIKSWTPPPLTARNAVVEERREGFQPASDIQLDAVADEYAAYMRSKGVVIGRPEEVAIRRAAMIQDAWRVAFGRILG